MSSEDFRNLFDEVNKLTNELQQSRIINRRQMAKIDNMSHDIEGLKIRLNRETKNAELFFTNFIEAEQALIKKDKEIKNLLKLLQNSECRRSPRFMRDVKTEPANLPDLEPAE